MQIEEYHDGALKTDCDGNTSTQGWKVYILLIFTCNFDRDIIDDRMQN